MAVPRKTVHGSRRHSLSWVPLWPGALGAVSGLPGKRSIKSASKPRHTSSNLRSASTASFRSSASCTDKTCCSSVERSAMQSGHWAGDSAPRLRLKASSMAERFLSARPPPFQSSWFQRFDEIIALVWASKPATSAARAVRWRPTMGLPPKTPALKTAIKAERAAFDLRRSLQRLDVKDFETIKQREPLSPEVRRGGKVVATESLLRHENRHDEP